MAGNPTPKERKKLTAQLRKKHEPYFDAIGEPNAIYIPKMFHFVKDLEGLQVGFFESELAHGQDVYTEKVSKSLESEDENRTLYKVRANPHFREEYPTSDPVGTTKSVRYFIPEDELEIVEMPSKEAEEVSITNDPDLGDVPMELMTLRDYAAIHLGVPQSSKPWLNDMITEATNTPF